MSILWRYIARHYALNIATLFVVLFSLVIVVDVVINLARFSRAAERLASESERTGSAVHHVLLTAVGVIDIWGPRLLPLFTYLNGVVLITAMGFTCAALVHQRETVAMLAGGVSLHRVGRPFLAVGALLIALQALTHEVLIPPVAHLLTRNAGESGRREAATFPVPMTPDDAGRVWMAGRFVPASGRLEQVHIWERDARGRLLREISAGAAMWDGSGWTLEGGSAAGAPAPGEASAIPTREPVARIASSLDPTRLNVRYLQGFGASLSWNQVSDVIGAGGLDERNVQRLERLRWGRLAGLLSNFIALWGALACFLVREPLPMLKPSLRASGVALGGFACGAIASSAAIPGLPVWIGVFLPSLVLLAITLALVSGVET